MKLIQACFSDQGAVRASNQDSIALIRADFGKNEVLLAVLADGMGGYAGGELASKYCVTELASWFRIRFPEILTVCGDSWREYAKGELEALFQVINHRLVELGNVKGGSPGSTLTAVLLAGEQFLVIHIGDSRAYLLADTAVQITADHSLVAAEVAKGVLTPEQAKADRRRNILVQCMGISEDLYPDIKFGEICPGQGLLLCSDGFWHEMTEPDLLSVLKCSHDPSGEELTGRLSALTNLVIERGERDNISSIAVLTCAEAGLSAVPAFFTRKKRTEEPPSFRILSETVLVHTDEEPELLQIEERGEKEPHPEESFFENEPQK